MSSTKRLGKLRHTHVLGIETKPGDSHTSAASLEDVVQLQRRAEAQDRHQASWACGLLHPRSLIFALFWVRSREIRDQAL